MLRVYIAGNLVISTLVTNAILIRGQSHLSNTADLKFNAESMLHTLLSPLLHKSWRATEITVKSLAREQMSYNDASRAVEHT